MSGVLTTTRYASAGELVAWAVVRNERFGICQTKKCGVSAPAVEDISPLRTPAAVVDDDASRRLYDADWRAGSGDPILLGEVRRPVHGNGRKVRPIR
jgi:hypothetical protein